jgi:hypothetical protein
MSSVKLPSTSEGDSSNQKERKKEEEFTVEVSNRFERLSEAEMDCPLENPNINVSSKKILPIIVHNLIRNQLASLRSVAQSLTVELQIKAKDNKTIFLAQNIEDYITLKNKVERQYYSFTHLVLSNNKFLEWL